MCQPERGLSSVTGFVSNVINLATNTVERCGLFKLMAEEQLPGPIKTAPIASQSRRCQASTGVLACRIGTHVTTRSPD